MDGQGVFRLDSFVFGYAFEGHSKGMVTSGVKWGCLFVCPNVGPSRPITGQAEQARPGVMHAPFRLTERVQERSPEEVRTNSEW